MKLLEYIGLDISRVKTAYRKVADALARDDFRAAQVKKLTSLGHGKFYRAKLNDADRLLFSLVKHNGEVFALMLEVIANHNYDKSRFLRGAAINDEKIPDIDVADAIKEAQPVRYLHPERTDIHLLDKPISFDDAQEAIYCQSPPLIVVGSAGSGKTALTLEKLKHAEGEVLYVTHSSYLAENARDLYYANGFEHTGQEAIFLSYREFVESIRVPIGREAIWRDFSAWFARMRQVFKNIDAHQVFEEIRGVITAGADGVLSRDDYQKLGVRQSIFPDDQRNKLYDLFKKYCVWLSDTKLYDLNLVAQEWQMLATPRYDFIVIDEVQDITTIQLALIFKSLKKPGHFLLCGDSNQIVHPNFFSWGQVKSLFWRDAQLAERQTLQVLTANFRNGLEATRIANQLLRIKQQRFGSIDKESNFLIQAIGGETGQAALIPDKDTHKKELNHKIRQSTQFAVLVMRDEDKALARKHFSTPLLFSIHEAKGLEYENIVLYRFVSDHRTAFANIVEGVNKADLASDTLDYRRAKDKSDKSLEIYKFFINALYVALTRAIKNLYIIESDTDHTLFSLLELTSADQVKVEAKQSSKEDWQKEARKLELQGKQEQAEAIRQTILKQKNVPWPIFNETKVNELLIKVFREQAPGNKSKQQLFEYAACHDEPKLAMWLAQEAKFEAAKNFSQQFIKLGQKSYISYFSRHFKDILRQCDEYGIEHRLPMNQTPLMAAAAAGNVLLAEALLARGADCESIDQYGYNALHWAMRVAFRDPKFAQGPFAALYELLAPASVDINTGERLIRIDQHLSEFFIFQTIWLMFRSGFTHYYWSRCAFDTKTILEAWQHLPSNVIRSERNKRQHISSVLSRNEINRDYAYNRKLFMRVATGWYQFNPEISVRRRYDGKDAQWIPIHQALNLPLIHEFSWAPKNRKNPRFESTHTGEYMARSGLADYPTPIAAERAIERQEATKQNSSPVHEPKPGTPEARESAIERLNNLIAENKRKRGKI